MDQIVDLLTILITVGVIGTVYYVLYNRIKRKFGESSRYSELSGGLDMADTSYEEVQSDNFLMQDREIGPNSQREFV
ncbi:unnamed protein product [Ambrosiozyma monospora]|uniref:Unnamed protein product n=1 Tax=Ambrosiozyma monospora TaxID=43982 RepID=A0ACB5T6M8_AMBMO|nr:unnamed protein product [Ambrosiozyma monospora]